MPRRTHNAMYFADDKDVQDLLLSAKRSLSLERLLRLARRRGIFLSRAYGREQLIDYLKCLPYNWKQLRELVEATESPERPERSTYTEVRGEVSQAALQRSLEQLRAERNESRAEVLQISATKNGHYSIAVEYSELDPSRMRLFQRRARSLRIDIERDTGGMRVRHEDNPRAQEIVEKLLSSVVESPDKTAIDRIDLSSIKEPRLRTQFFVHLMTKMESFRLEDVRVMDVATIPADSEQEDGPDDVDGPEDADAAPGEQEDDHVEQRLSPPEVKLIAMVKKAVLEGSNLLQSDEYKSFTKSGFFISRSSWFGIETSGQGRRVEFDARFADPRNAGRFSYRVVSTYEAVKGGRFRKLPPSSIKDRELWRQLEDTARSAAENAKRDFAAQGSTD